MQNFDNNGSQCENSLAQLGIAQESSSFLLASRRRALLPSTSTITSSKVRCPHFSNVSFHKGMVPLTIVTVVNLSCDGMLYEMGEEVADEGLMKTVKLGRGGGGGGGGDSFLST